MMGITQQEVGIPAVERDDLINESLPMIKHIAHRVAVRLPPNVEICDLVNAGVIGLLDAVEKFEPERGVKFKTYAELRIRGAMLDSLRELDWHRARSERRARTSKGFTRIWGSNSAVRQPMKKSARNSVAIWMSSMRSLTNSMD